MFTTIIGKRGWANGLNLSKDTLADIKKMPSSASIAYGNTRYKVVAKFPYVILYRIQGNIIFIARVFNTYQQPVY
jgi:hypothetical protein